MFVEYHYAYLIQLVFRQTEDVVEKIGVERSKMVLKDADLVLLVLNSNDTLTDEDIEIFEQVKGMDVIVILNKQDLPQVIDMEKVKELAIDYPIVQTSLLQEEGINELEDAIAKLFFAGNLESGDLTYLSNTRHIALIQQAVDCMESALQEIQLGTPIDIVQIDVTRSWELLGEVIGESVQDSLINQLFSQFCLGK